LVLFDKKAETAIIVDIAISLDDNLETTIAEKKRKYLPLAVELKDIYKLRSTSIVPLVVSTNGLVTKEWSKSMENLQLHERHCRTMQKAASSWYCQHFAQGSQPRLVTIYACMSGTYSA
jgi:hypothetical protein